MSGLRDKLYAKLLLPRKKVARGGEEDLQLTLAFSLSRRRIQDSSVAAACPEPARPPMSVYPFKIFFKQACMCSGYTSRIHVVAAVLLYTPRVC